mgnify:CR=1 FL=1
MIGISKFLDIRWAKRQNVSKFDKNDVCDYIPSLQLRKRILGA